MRILNFLLGGSGGGLVVGGLVFAGVFAAWQMDRASQREVGALTERVKTEEENEQVIRRADRVRTRVRSRRVSGVRDPHAADR